jgi:hypothetical protein
MRESVDPEEFIFGEDDPDYIAALALADHVAMERAETALAIFIAGGETEEALIGLMEDHSDDNTEGGYYTNISKYPYQTAHVSAMKVVPEIEEWLFDDARVIGDSELVRTEAFGYHLLYFTGFGERFSDIIAEDMLRTQEHNAWRDNLADVIPVKHRAFILVQV